MRSHLVRLLAVVLLLGACGGDEPMTVAEFCELSRQGDLETARLFSLEPGSAEFETQLALVRDINDRLFGNAPAEIAPVTEELAPLLTLTDANNDQVNQLLDQVAAYVEQNCPDVESGPGEARSAPPRI